MPNGRGRDVTRQQHQLSPDLCSMPPRGQPLFLGAAVVAAAVAVAGVAAVAVVAAAAVVAAVAFVAAVVVAAVGTAARRAGCSSGYNPIEKALLFPIRALVRKKALL